MIQSQPQFPLLFYENHIPPKIIPKNPLWEIASFPTGHQNPQSSQRIRVGSPGTQEVLTSISLRREAPNTATLMPRWKGPNIPNIPGASHGEILRKSLGNMWRTEFLGMGLGFSQSRNCEY